MRGPMGKIGVLIVDDSASIRRTLSDIINADPGLDVIATAPDPFVAAERIARQVPDVIILDIEMPRMDGVTFLRKIMAQRPIPVIMCSSLSDEGSQVLVDAMEAGAVDVIAKPRVDTRQFLLEASVRICDAVKAAARARMSRAGVKVPLQVEKKLTADVIMPPPLPRRTAGCPLTERVVCIGASTGGTESLRQVLVALKPNCPGVVVVQHMPEKFTAAFAHRLNGLCQVEVKEAVDGHVVLPGRVLIAQGNRHMLLHRNGVRYHVNLKDGPLVSRHRPSVDVLFRSAAQYAGANAVGILMTGMGDDGAKGLLEMKRSGAFTLAQDEETCVVFGMPREAIALGAADKIVPLDLIATEILRLRSPT
jgi:two-component system chemotaxis response regulator CheB